MVHMVVSVVAAMALTLGSKSFTDGGTLPQWTVYNSYGCTGRNTPPELHWSGAPAGTKSFVLTMHDPDAPVPGGWWHWVLFNIPATEMGIYAATPNGAGIPGVSGTTSFKSRGYGGPCPPPGKQHHYVFTLYALDIPSVPGVSGDTTGPELLKAMDGHILAKTSLTGLYGR